jgi:nucleotide-binding universal stress UspA family protein
MGTQRFGVLVGVDQSECGRLALDWAVADAAGWGGRLTVVHVVDLPQIADVPLSAELLAAADRNGQHVVDAALVRARRAAAGLAVEAQLVSGHPAAELLRLAGSAAEVVLGSRGHGGFGSLLLGSTAAQVAAHAPGPVVVVRGQGTNGGSVVVGVDGSDRAEAALEYGFGYAARHGLPLHALHLCPIHVAMPPYALPPLHVDVDRVHADAEHFVSQAVDSWSVKHPEVSATWTVADGSAVRGLVEASRGSSLLVVGCRGYGGLTGMLLGSVSQAAVRHAHCPVAVAR